MNINIQDTLVKTALTAVISVSGYAATQLGSLSNSVSSLNTNVAVLVAELKSIKDATDTMKSDAQTDRKILADHEKRITILETKSNNRK